MDSAVGGIAIHGISCLYDHACGRSATINAGANFCWVCVADYYCRRLWCVLSRGYLGNVCNDRGVFLFNLLVLVSYGGWSAICKSLHCFKARFFSGFFWVLFGLLLNELFLSKFMVGVVGSSPIAPIS